MKSYLRSIARVLKSELSITEFDDTKLPGVKTVINNRFRELRGKGLTLESHNTLFIPDLYKIYDFLNDDAKKMPEVTVTGYLFQSDLSVDCVLHHYAL